MERVAMPTSYRLRRGLLSVLAVLTLLSGGVLTASAAQAAPAHPRFDPCPCTVKACRPVCVAN